MIGQLIPFIAIRKSNNTLRKKNQDPSTIEIPNNIEEIDYNCLEDDYKATIEAKNRFEDKAKSIIAALTIAITLILNISKIIDTITTKIPLPYFNYIIFVLAVFSIMYMLMAGIMSIQVLIKENLLYPISLMDRTRQNKKNIFKATKQNINQNLIRNNIIYAAYLSIRNSVICLLIIFVFAIFPYQISENIDSHLTQAKNEANLAYSNEAIEWIIYNNQKNINFDKIIEVYTNKYNDGTPQNIYDKSQGIIVTIELQNDLYFLSDIKNNITEISEDE